MTHVQPQQITIARALTLSALLPIGCESVYTPPCPDGCVKADRCASDYPVLSEPEFLYTPQELATWFARQCDPPPANAAAAEVSCNDGEGLAAVSFDETGRILTLRHELGSSISEHEFSYAGPQLIHRRNTSLDGTTVYAESLTNIEWSGTVPQAQLTIQLDPGAGNGSERARDGAYYRYETTHRWDTLGRHSSSETLLGAARVFSQSRNLTWAGEQLELVVTVTDWGDSRTTQPDCEEVNATTFSCDTTFEYVDGQMVSFSEMGATTIISDRCCPSGCIDGELPPAPPGVDR